ncbi:hypothetical protein [Methylorubrum extorquens]|uniref:hypothetical protein n=1 Tax=Methylorubrum extorquens TaxID=408 RepID=UPI001EE5A898|nr:hypothetical protein [Methylorubrum extorquens]MCG5247323.1 hypothetical protein [Methylorubrum extorquens]
MSDDRPIPGDKASARHGSNVGNGAVDEAEIRRIVLDRNAVRREACLPPLDIEKEVEHALSVATGIAAGKRYRGLRHDHAKEFENIRSKIIAKARASGNSTFPNGFFGNYYLNRSCEDKLAEILAGSQKSNSEEGQ